jgi:hypothetical protein
VTGTRMEPATVPSMGGPGRLWAMFPDVKGAGR